VGLPDGRGGTVLIPARYLVNGATIVQEFRDWISYYHIELESHGVVVAEGLGAESYLDTGNRTGFGNGCSRRSVVPGRWEAWPPDYAQGRFIQAT
jgi:Hint domain